MANIVEQATLKVNDQSSAQIAKINAELKKLAATAASLKKIKIDISVNASGLNKLAQVHQQVTSLQRIASRTLTLKVNATATGLQRVQQQLQTLQNTAQRGVHIRTTPPGAPPAPPHAARGAAGARGGGVTAAAAAGGVSSLFHLASGTFGGLTLYAIGQHLKESLREGAKGADLGEMSLRLKQLSPSDLAAARQAIQDITEQKGTLPGGAFLNIGQRTQSMSESLGVMNDNVQAAAQLTSIQEEFTRLLVAQGKTMEAATEGAVNYGKGLEQMGRFTVHTSQRAAELTRQLGMQVNVGDPDVSRMKDSFGWLMQLAPGIGKEFTGEFVRQMGKYLSGSKYAISDEAFGAVLMLGEEYGTRAAVGYNQAVKQLSGKGLTKAALAKQHEYGLIDITPQWTGEYDKKGRKKIKPMVDESSQDYKDWIRLVQTDLPKAATSEKMARALEKAGVDRGDPQQVYKFASSILSERTAIETLAALIYRGPELQKNIAEAKKRTKDPNVIRALTAGSITLASAGMANQFQSILGQTVLAISPVLTPVMKSASDVMGKFASSMNQAVYGPDEESRRKAQSDVEGMLAKGLTYGAAGAGGAWMLNKAVGMMTSAFTGPMGMAATLAAATAPGQSPAAQGLSWAAVALQAAGQTLLSAGNKMTSFWTGMIPGSLKTLGTAGLAAGAIGTMTWAATDYEGFEKQVLDLYKDYVLPSVLDSKLRAAGEELTAAKMGADKEAGFLKQKEEQLNQMRAYKPSRAEGTEHGKLLTDLEKEVNGSRVNLNKFRERIVNAQQEFDRLAAIIKENNAAAGAPPSPSLMRKMWDWLVPKNATTADVSDITKPEAYYKMRRDMMEKRRRAKMTEAQRILEDEGIDPSYMEGGWPMLPEHKKIVDRVIYNNELSRKRAAAKLKKQLEEQRKRFPKGFPIPTPRPKDLPEFKESDFVGTGEADMPSRPFHKPPKWGQRDREVTEAPATDPLTTAATTLGTNAIQLASAATTLNDALPVYATTINESGNALALSAETLADVPSTFETTFSTGATEIGNAGQIAADILIGAAPGIGGAIGEAAASAIQGAVSGLSINVNANVKQGNTGTQDSHEQ